MAPRIRLGELLVRAGVLDEFKLKAALAEQQRWGGKLGKILVDMNFVSEDLLVKALSKQLTVPVARLETFDVPDEILDKIDQAFARQYGVCPERLLPDRKTLILAMIDPINVKAIDEVTYRTGLRVEPTLAGERVLALALGRVYGTEASALDHPSNPVLTNNAGGVIEPTGHPSLPDGGMEMEPLAASVVPAPSSPPTTPHERAISEPASVPPGPVAEMAEALDDAQRKQLKAIRVMVDLLIEKGVFSRDEYLARINRR